MKNINYKYVTLILSFLLIVTYAWGWDNMFMYSNSDMTGINMRESNNSHMMNMDNDDMNMDHSMESAMDSMTMNDMVSMMDGKSGKALEKEFITGMIPHHQGAVAMAKKLLADSTVSAELKAFANRIISAQEGEIKMMSEWLKKY